MASIQATISSHFALIVGYFDGALRTDWSFGNNIISRIQITLELFIFRYFFQTRWNSEQLIAQFFDLNCQKNASIKNQTTPMPYCANVTNELNGIFMKIGNGRRS